jgi:phosphatidylinositol alpha-1,6-mannosyltransferase
VRERRRGNREAFEWHVVPTRSFAVLVGLDESRIIVGGNGTDVTRIRPIPWPSRPAVGFVSGAAPGRGIEDLVAAVRLAREVVPDLRLLLWLVATGTSSEEYLRDLRVSLDREPYVELGSVPYDELGTQLGRATTLAIAHPPNDYMDVALPVKLFDSLAAGRPLIVTPRTETAALVRRHDVGVVTAGDSIDDLARAIADMVGDDARARALGAQARTVAEREFDWSIVGGRIADAILERVGETR